MKTGTLGAVALVVATALPGAGLARDLCNSMGATQAFDVETRCVSSALAPQSGNRYDVHALTDGSDRSAWCDGRTGHGVGETITFEWGNAAPLRAIWVTNGYAKSDSTWTRNSRVKDMRVTFYSGANMGSGGQSTTIRLADTAREQPIQIPWAHNNPLGVQLTILSVYPGSKYTDTCISGMWTDFGF